MDNMRVPAAANSMEETEAVWENQWNGLFDPLVRSIAAINLEMPGEDQETPAKPSPAPSPRLTAAKMLAIASEIVGGSRNDTHGDKRDTFTAIAMAWQFYLDNRQFPKSQIRPVDVAFMMERLKEIRADYGQPMDDHFIDATGYTAIAGELMLDDRYD